MGARADLLLRRDFRAPKSAERHAIEVHELVEVGALASRLLKLANAVQVRALLESAEERLDVIMDLLALLRCDERAKSSKKRASSGRNTCFEFAEFERAASLSHLDMQTRKS